VVGGVFDVEYYGYVMLFGFGECFVVLFLLVDGIVFVL